MPLVNSVGTCEECHKMFEFTLFHSGVTNSCYAYCEGCGTTAILDISDGRFLLELVKFSAYKVIAPDLERYLKPCACGARFTARAADACWLGVAGRLSTGVRSGRAQAGRPAYR